jgi:hypothetical protein
LDVEILILPEQVTSAAVSQALLEFLTATRALWPFIDVNPNLSKEQERDKEADNLVWGGEVLRRAVSGKNTMQKPG